jgi:hypothetical protein
MRVFVVDACKHDRAERSCSGVGARELVSGYWILEINI